MAEELWVVDANGYCGVAVPTHVMKRLMKEFTRHESHIKEILRDNAGELHAYRWTVSACANPQVTVYFKGRAEDVENRINLFRARQPKRVELLDVQTYEEAKDFANRLRDKQLQDGTDE